MGMAMETDFAEAVLKEFLGGLYPGACEWGDEVVDMERGGAGW